MCPNDMEVFSRGSFSLGLWDFLLCNFDWITLKLSELLRIFFITSFENSVRIIHTSCSLGSFTEVLLDFLPIYEWVSDFYSQNDYSKIINLDLTEGKFDDFLGQNQFDSYV